MSCQKMTLCDKILALIQENGPLTSERVTFLLKEKYTVNRNLRTVQRYIKELVTEDKLIKIVSSGRSQSYEIKTNNGASKKGLSEFFENKLWDELFQIKDVLNSNYRPPFDDNWYKSYKRLVSLVKLLPIEIKQEIMPEIEKSGAITDKEKEAIKKRLEGESGLLEVDDDSLEYEIDHLLRQRLETVMDKIATLIHERDNA